VGAPLQTVHAQKSPELLSQRWARREGISYVACSRVARPANRRSAISIIDNEIGRLNDT